MNYLKLIERCKILIPRNNKRENEELIQELNKMLNKLQNWCSTKKYAYKRPKSTFRTNFFSSFNSETKYYRQSCFDDMSNTITTQISQIVKKESFNSFNRAQIDVQSLPNDLVKNHLNTLNSQFLYNIKKV